MSVPGTVLSIGVVGAGEITRKSHLPVLVNMPDVKIDWLYDQRATSARALAGAYGLPAVHAPSPSELPACDVVLLAIPVDARLAYLDLIRARGGAAFCEKPFALSAADHTREVQRFAPHALGAGFMRRFFRPTILMRQVVVERIFGCLRKIEICEGNRSKGSGTDSSFLDDPRLGRSRGVLVDLGSHTIDLALHISGATGFRVQSSAAVMDGAVDRKLAASVQLDVGVGKPVELDYTVSWLDRQPNRVTLTFDNAVVWSGLGPAAEVFVGRHGKPRDLFCLSSPTAGATTYGQAFYLEWRAFLSGFRSQTESIVSARSADLTTQLVEALGAAGSKHA
jgi:predicted dehydrogenase